MNAFVVLVPFHYYLFRSIYRNLKDSVFIIPPMENKKMSDNYGSGMSGVGLYNYMASFLKNKQVNTIEYGEITKDNFIKYISENVNCIICPHYFDGIDEIQNTRVFKIVYGIPNNDSDQFNYKSHFNVDLIFTSGPESSKRFRERKFTSLAVGNPLFDFWFSSQFDDVALEPIRSKLIESKPTILYLPTHCYYSSIDQFGDTIIALAQKYNIIVKLHHATFNGEANRLCKFISIPEIITLGDFFDPVILHKVADIVLTDVSGALFDRLLIKKPVIMLVNSLLKYKVAILSPKQQSAPVEESGLFPYTENPDDVEVLIENNLYKNVSVNEDLLYSLFYKRDGLAGERIAEAILNDREYPTIPTLEKYEKAIENAPDKETRDYIINKRNCSIKKYHRVAIEKPNILKRVLKRLSFG